MTRARVIFKRKQKHKIDIYRALFVIRNENSEYFFENSPNCYI